MNRTAKSMKNLKYGVILQVVDIVLKFTMRTVFVYTLGNEALGLSGLFTELLGMLSLAEMGIWSVISYSLYKPLAENDEVRIRRLMELFRRSYQIIAAFIFVAGLAILPWVHLLVKEIDYDVGYIRVVFFLYLLATSSSYLFSYKTTLFNADQKAYKVTRIRIFMDAIGVTLKILSLILFKNFLIFLGIDVVLQLVRNLFINASANRTYPYLRQKSDLPEPSERKEIFSGIRHLFIGTLSGKITTSTDNVLISVLDNTLAVGFYSNYSMIINNARSIALQITASTTGGIGNIMATDLERSYITLKRLTMVMFVVGNTLCAGLYSQLTPFIAAWLGQSRVLPDSVVMVLALNFFLCVIREPLWQYTSASGLFKENRNISIIGSGTNLVVSLLLGYKLGMLGIFIGTTLTLVIQYVLKARLLCQKKFARSSMDFMLFSGRCLLTTAVSSAAAKWASSYINVGGAWVNIILGAAASCVISFAILYILFARTGEWKYCMLMANKFIARVKQRFAKRGASV